MEYTIENYKKGQLPNITDKVKIGEFLFQVAHSENGFWLNGLSCYNDAFTKYLKGENKYRFAERVTAEYGGIHDGDSGVCPYINTMNGLAELIRALWDMAGSKETASGLLKEDDVVNIGPFQYAICKTHSGFFLGLNNGDEIKEKFGHISNGNDVIFRLLEINKNYFFSSVLKDISAYEIVSDESMACPYAKTLGGLNKVIVALQKEYSDFVSSKKKTTKWTKAEPKPCRACDSSDSKNISITIPRKSNPVKLKIIL